MLKLHAAGALLLLASPLLRAQRTPSIPRSPDAPLQIESVRATLPDFLDAVKIRNTSSKPIATFQLAVAMTAPEPCSTSRLHIVTRSLLPDHAAVKPGDSISTFTYGVKPAEYAAFAASHGGHDVLSVLTIVKVTFSDGTTWSRPHEGHAFSEQYLRNDRAWLCSHQARQASTPRAHTNG
jgi:hypothetical protein